MQRDGVNRTAEPFEEDDKAANAMHYSHRIGCALP
jgi:hypothetical protein